MALFSTKGRLARLPFLLRALAISLAFYPVNIIGGLGWAGRRPADAADVLPGWLAGQALPEPFADITLGLAAVILIALFVAMLAVSARRCHDLGLPGWFLFLPFLIILFLPHVALPPPIYSLWPWVWIVVLAAWPGKAGPNRYGTAAAPPLVQPVAVD